MIKVKNLNKYYNKGKTNELHVINNTTLDLPDTGLICILGESGSGKTTLMNTISGLDDFVDGTIDVDGIEIKKFGDTNQERVRNEKFGYIFQNYYLLQDRTVEYNLMLSLGLYEISDEEKEERIDYVLKAVDMWRYKKRLVSQLSGGQQQRIAIARALAKSPKVIFADEPTGNLDEANTMRTMSILKKISDRCLVVVVTHEKTIADFFADRIIVIADGKIEGDREKTGNTTYSYIEDNNIYLGEYEKRELANENVNIEVYDNGEKPDVGIKLICDNGKIYISIGDAKNIEILSTESEKQVLEGKKPVVEMSDIDEFDYSLSELTCTKKPKLGMSEIKNIAISNIKAMGKKQIFLAISLMAMAVMIVLAVQDIMSIVAVKEQDVLTTDKNLSKISIEKGTFISATDYLDAKKELLNTIEDETPDVYKKLIVNPETSFSYEYEGFSQLQDVKANITVFSILPLDVLDEDSLIYGEMPKNDNEVVIDRWVLEKFVENSNELSNVINNVNHFIGKKITASNGTKLTIVGICESEEMDIYVARDEIVNLKKNVTTYIKYSDYVKNINPEYKGIELGKSEDGLYQVLVSETEYDANYKIYAKSEYADIENYENMIETYDMEKERYQQLLNRIENLDGKEKREKEDELQWRGEVVKDLEKEIEELYEELLQTYNVSSYEECLQIRDNKEGYTYKLTTSAGSTFEVVGYYGSLEANEIGAQLVIADEADEHITNDVMSSSNSFFIHGMSVEEIEDYFASFPSSITSKLNIMVSNPAQEILKEYRAKKSEDFNSRIIVTVTIFMVSLVILYFMMKASAVQRIGDLGVYRLIGISKSSIVGLFAFENAVLTTYTSLVGAVLTTFVTFIISSIPSLGFEINYPWYAFILTILFLYLANIVVGVLPIRKLLKLPPAQLASKYDI